MAIHQLVQAVCKVNWVKRRRPVYHCAHSVIPVAVAEGGLLGQGLFMAVIPHLLSADTLS